MSKVRADYRISDFAYAHINGFSIVPLRHAKTLGTLFAVGAMIAVVCFFLSRRPETSLSTKRPDLLFRGFESKQGTKWAVLEFSNPTSKTIYFHADSRGTPLYQFEWWSKGKWKHEVLICGHPHIEVRELAAGKMIEFSVEVSGDPIRETVVIGVGEKPPARVKKAIRVEISYGFDRQSIKTLLRCQAIEFMVFERTHAAIHVR